MPLVTGSDREACGKLSPCLTKISYHHISCGSRELLGCGSIWFKGGGGDQEKIINHSTLSMFRMNPSTPKRLSNVRLAIKRNSILCVWANSLLVIFFHIISSFQISCKEDRKNLHISFSDSTTVTLSSTCIIICLLVLCMCGYVCVFNFLNHL